MTSIIQKVGKTAFDLAFNASPILLTGGVAEGIPIGLPIMLLTESLSIASGAISSIASGSVNGIAPQFDSWFCNFRPLPGGQMISNVVAEYPFYTNMIAANAQIPQPLPVSLLMYCPANNNTPFPIKAAVMLALQATLQNHTALGGSYTVLTPSTIYQNCLLRAVTDVSSNESNQPQFAYQWDFVQPLLTFPIGGTILNKLMSSVTGGIASGVKSIL